MYIIDKIKRKGLRYCLRDAKKELIPVVLVKERPVMDIIFQWRAYRFLKRKYLPKLRLYNNTRIMDKSSLSATKTIWVFWMQGEESAPPIVKKCIQSIRRHAGFCEVKVITKDNITNFMETPKYIEKALEEKRMSLTFFSDYVRITLLTKYGGIWIDATVLLTDDIPNKIAESPLFLFQHAPQCTEIPVVGSSWFLVSKAHNPILEQVKFLVEEYWQHERHLCNYYLLHLLLTLVLRLNDENMQILKQMPYYSNGECHLLQFALADKFEEQRFNDICSKSFCHKLTYKFPNLEAMKSPDTFFAYISTHEF